MPKRSIILLATVALVPVGCMKLIPGLGKKAPATSPAVPAPVVAPAAPTAGTTPGPTPADPGPVAGAPATPMTPATPAAPAAGGDQYGPLAGEQFLPAEPAGPSVPLRPRKTDTIYTLSNARLGTPPPSRFGGPRMNGQAIMVDWQRTHESTNNGMAIVIRDAGGHDQTVGLSGAFNNRAGTIALEVPYRGPFTGKVPDNCELYLVRTEARYGPDFTRTFKVSNSVLLGQTKFPITQARNWTAAEQAKFSTPPPEGPKDLLANPGVGEDTEMAGGPEPHNLKRWFVDNGKPLVGFDYFVGGWEGEQCLWRLNAIFDRDFPTTGGQQRALAKAGYAVGGLTVKSNKYVNAVKVTFMKIGPDGKLDPADKYDSPWLGPKEVGKKETTLGGDGRTVVGFIRDSGAVVHAVGLVMDAK